MDLEKLRSEIDGIDDEILKLFIRRMEVCKGVADFKRQKGLPVMQNGRELEIISKVRSKAPSELEDGAAILFQNIMDISKSLQCERISDSEGSSTLADCLINPQNTPAFDPKNKGTIGCQGIKGSYQEDACLKIFGASRESDIKFFPRFQDVFQAVEDGVLDYGILPIQNTTAGSVGETYSLMSEYNLHICANVRMPIVHCLAVRPGVKPEEISTVFSHEQALRQCSNHLRSRGLSAKEQPNTSIAAELCSRSAEPIGVICSKRCAEIYGLETIAEDISNVAPNFTRFLCISKEFLLAKEPLKPEVISLALTIPNQPGSLCRLLTRFAVNHLDLLHLESTPSKNGTFDTLFYLDFSGSILDNRVALLLAQLQSELSSFKFLGNYPTIS